MQVRWLLPATIALLLAGSAQAENALIDYQGYAWETGGFPPSNAGDVLSFVGVVDNLDARFGVNLLLEEVTLYVTDLASSGQVDIGGGVLSIAYNSGTINLYRDPSRDHDYGVNPPSATAPASFVNGTPFLTGTLSTFFMAYDPSTGSGAYEGQIAFTGGSGLGTLSLLNANGYTFGGTLSRPAAGGNVPQGYDLQVDGVIEVEVRVGVESSSWSHIKEMYRR
jgi:hypothetical protein